MIQELGIFSLGNWVFYLGESSLCVHLCKSTYVNENVHRNACSALKLHSLLRQRSPHNVVKWVERTYTLKVGIMDKLLGRLSSCLLILNSRTLSNSL